MPASLSASYPRLRQQNNHFLWRRFNRGMAVDESTKKKSALTILSIEAARKLLHLVAAGFNVEADEWEKNSWLERFGSLSLSVPPMDLAPIIAVVASAGCAPRNPPA